MAMGLSFLGRRRERMSVSPGHVGAAVLAGGLVGFLAGMIGQPIHEVSPEVVILAEVPPCGETRRGYGRHRQVPVAGLGHTAPGGRTRLGARCSGRASPRSSRTPPIWCCWPPSSSPARRPEPSQAPRSGSPAGWWPWCWPGAGGRPPRLPTCCRGLRRLPPGGNLAVAALGGLALLGVT